MEFLWNALIYLILMVVVGFVIAMLYIMFHDETSSGPISDKDAEKASQVVLVERLPAIPKPPRENQYQTTETLRHQYIQEHQPIINKQSISEPRGDFGSIKRFEERKAPAQKQKREIKDEEVRSTFSKDNVNPSTNGRDIEPTQGRVPMIKSRQLLEDTKKRQTKRKKMIFFQVLDCYPITPNANQIHQTDSSENLESNKVKRSRKIEDETTPNKRSNNNNTDMNIIEDEKQNPEDNQLQTRTSKKRSSTNKQGNGSEDESSSRSSKSPSKKTRNDDQIETFSPSTSTMGLRKRAVPPKSTTYSSSKRVSLASPRKKQKE